MPNLFYGRKKRKREEEPAKQLEEQPEIKREKLEEEKSNVPSLFQLTLPYLRQYALELLNRKKSLSISPDQPIPIEVFSKIFNDPLFFGNTMFHLISDSNDVQSLLERGANPNIQNFDGQTVLNYYLAQHKIELAQKLLELAPDSLDVSTPDRFGSTPLLNAIKTGDYDIVESIMNRALGNPEIDIHSYILQGNTINQTPCILATIYAPELLPLLLPYINLEDEHLLIVATKNNYVKSIKILLKNDYPIDLVDSHGLDAFAYAVGAGNEAAIDELLKYKPDLKKVYVKFKPEKTIASIAGQTGSISIASKLLKAGLDIDNQTNYSGTMLYNAAISGHLQLVKFLLAHGANPNRHTFKDNSLLHGFFKRYRGDFNNISLILEIITALIESPQFNIKKGKLIYEFMTERLIDKISHEAQIEIVKLFIAHGIPIPKDALEAAQDQDYQEIYKFLKESQENQ